MKCYKDLEEWLCDYKIFRENSNDKDLLISMTLKLEGTDKELKKEITNYIENDALLVNPMQVIKNLYKKSDEAFVIIKDKDDIWFEV